MSFQEITPQQAMEIMNNEHAALIDVREPAEHANRHIPDSHLHPLGRISANALPPANKLLIYCQKGIRSRKASEKILIDNPELNVFSIQGGIEAWEQAGLDTQAGKSNIMSLDRQVQLAIGCLVVIFSILALSVSGAFVWVTLAIGAGLILAGSTGFCGLGRVIAMMPWNQHL